MNTLIRMMAVAAAGILLGGCTPRFANPMIAKDMTVARPELVGSWHEEKDGKPTGGQMVASAASELAGEGIANVYRLRVVLPEKDSEKKDQPPEHATLLAGFVRCGGAEFVNMTSDLEAERANNKALLAMPVYAVAKVHFDTPDSFTFALLRDKWMVDLLKAEPGVLSHVELESGLLVTATGEEQRAFFEKHANDEEAWQDVTTWKRDAKQ